MAIFHCYVSLPEGTHMTHPRCPQINDALQSSLGCCQCLQQCGSRSPCLLVPSYLAQQKTGLHSVRKNGGIMEDGLLVQHFVSKIWPFFRQALGALKNTWALHFLVV
jgi:hypothetical protein